MVVIPSNGGAPINMKEAHIDELGGFPLDMTRNAYYDNKFPTGYNEAFFVVQPMDILDYVEEHAPESLDEVKKKNQVHIGRPEPCAIGHKVEIKVAKNGESARILEMAEKNAFNCLKNSVVDDENDNIILRMYEILHLKKIPNKIESYDISNIGTEFKTAGMVVCENGEFVKADYRNFRIKTVEGADDYASMTEAILRRLGVGNWKIFGAHGSPKDYSVK